MTLGSPPQSFRAVVDISQVDVVVTSSECDDGASWSGICNSGHFQYHGSWSKSTVPSTQLIQGDYPLLLYQARVTKDRFSLAGLEIDLQGFHEAIEAFPDPFTPWVNEFDAILGFSIDDHDSVAGLKSPMTNMLENDVISYGMVSIMLGRWGRKIGLVPGEIAIGGVNEQMLKPGTTVRFIPVSNRIDPPHAESRYLNGTWQVEAQSVGFTWYNDTSGENLTVYHELPAATGTARFDTIWPSISLPAQVAEPLEQIGQPSRHFFSHPVIPCQRISILPDLLFHLGGKEFVLRPEDYILETVKRQGDEDNGCIWTIEAIPRLPGRTADILGLGSPFLRAFYTVLDRDRRNIGFGEPRWKSWADEDIPGSWLPSPRGRD